MLQRPASARYTVSPSGSTRMLKHSASANFSAGVKTPSPPMKRENLPRTRRLSAIDMVSNIGELVVPVIAEPGELEERPQMRVARLLYASNWGVVYDALLCVCSLMACGGYVVSTYWHDLEYVDQLVAFLTLWFVADFSLELFLAEKRVEHLCRLPVLLDVVALLGPAAAIGRSGDLRGVALRAPLLLHIFRLRKSPRLLVKVESAVRRQVIWLGITVLCLIVVSCGLLHLVENTDGLREDPPDVDASVYINLHDVLYMVVMSITTVGYGDISPQTTLGRAVIMLMLITALVVVPQQSRRLVAIMSLNTVYERTYHKPGGDPHVLVTGHLHGESVTAFFTELYHEDHPGTTSLHTVLLALGFPGPEVYALLSDPVHGYYLKFIDGNVLLDRDLQRADAAHARMLFVLSNKLSRNPDREDASAIFRIIAIKRFRQQCGPEAVMPACAQMLVPKSKRLLSSALRAMGETEGPQSCHALCVLELKMGFLGKSVLCPGIVPLLSNLISSTADVEAPEEDSDVPKWVAEYAAGCELEIYRVRLSDAFRGAPFVDASHAVYRRSGVLLFALELDAEGLDPLVVLNPAAAPIPTNSGVQLFGFVLAEDHTEAEIVSTIADLELPDELYDVLGEGDHVDREDDDDELLADEMLQGEDTDDKEGKERTLAAVLGRRVKLPAATRGRGRPTLQAGQVAAAAALAGIKAAQRPSASPTASSSSASSSSCSASTLRSRKRLAWLSQRRRFLVRSRAVSLADATLNDVADLSPDLAGHIIITGDVTDLLDFVLPLRSRQNLAVHPIIILSMHPPKKRQWETIARFVDVFYVHGSPLEDGDLLRVRVDHAAAVVILSMPDYSCSLRARRTTSLPNSKQEADRHRRVNLHDAAAVFAYHKVCHRVPLVLCDLINRQSMSMLRPATTSDVEVANVFAAGRVYDGSVMDTLASQTLYNRHLLTIIRQLLIGSDPRVTALWKRAHPRIMQSMPQAHLYTVRVPRALVGGSYSDAFEWAVEEGMVPLGVYRGKSSSRGNSMPYTFTNPPGSVVLKKHDRVFVLGHDEPDTKYEFTLEQRERLGALRAVMTDVGDELAEEAHYMRKDLEALLRRITDAGHKNASNRAKLQAARAADPSIPLLPEAVRPHEPRKKKNKKGKPKPKKKPQPPSSSASAAPSPSPPVRPPARAGREEPERPQSAGDGWPWRYSGWADEQRPEVDSPKAATDAAGVVVSAVQRWSAKQLTHRLRVARAQERGEMLLVRRTQVDTESWYQSGDRVFLIANGGDEWKVLLGPTPDVAWRQVLARASLNGGPLLWEGTQQAPGYFYVDGEGAVEHEAPSSSGASGSARPASAAPVSSSIARPGSAAPVRPASAAPVSAGATSVSSGSSSIARPGSATSVSSGSSSIAGPGSATSVSSGSSSIARPGSATSVSSGSSSIARPAPVRPMSAAPVRPGSAAPTRPGSAAPVRPGLAAPTRPGSAAPVRPGSAAPVRLATAAPVRPDSAAPASSAAPVRPTSAAPVRPAYPTQTRPASAGPPLHDFHSGGEPLSGFRLGGEDSGPPLDESGSDFSGSNSGSEGFSGSESDGGFSEREGDEVFSAREGDEEFLFTEAGPDE